jgi:hypothetical protein
MFRGGGAAPMYNGMDISDGVRVVERKGLHK